ncbi:MAG: hypothetical protein HYR66_07535 [Sphingobacteriales bacterium]|nr:hypothetical protein [Sphingobacteriales bacterium]MBI3718411.1 hypothetical protein [Sphingobacteriales bacterium]
MKAATISELKQELTNCTPTQITELCLRLARFKKENKELLTYLLFETHDTVTYIQSVKKEMDEQFAGINKSNAYFIKKTLRKIIRMINKYTRYSSLAAVEAELLIYFCHQMKDMDIATSSNQVLSNIYQAQLKRINKAISTMHEDLQYDYLREIKTL